MERTYKELTNKQKRYLVIKRIIDIVGSFMGIVILSIFMVIVGIITKATSKGPAIYKQKRYGQHLKPFTCLKFRSMVKDAPQVAAFEMTNELHNKLMTKWGRFMRKHSIDEWLQLFNIFAGQMSFVGPRPVAIGMDDWLKNIRLEQEYNPYSVKPGLTGYAQIWMNRTHKPEDKAWFDSQYVKLLSFSLDTRLFVRTFIRPPQGK